MGQSSKKAICIRLDVETIEKLQHICNAEKRKPANIIEIMIQNYNLNQWVVTPIVTPERIKAAESVKPEQVIKQVISEPKKAVVKAVTKPTDKEPTMMELLKQSRLNS